MYVYFITYYPILITLPTAILNLPINSFCSFVIKVRIIILNENNLREYGWVVGFGLQVHAVRVAEPAPVQPGPRPPGESVHPPQLHVVCHRLAHAARLRLSPQVSSRVLYFAGLAPTSGTTPILVTMNPMSSRTSSVCSTPSGSPLAPWCNREAILHPSKALFFF